MNNLEADDGGRPELFLPQPSHADMRVACGVVVDKIEDEETG
jgi:hypothetical protein